MRIIFIFKPSNDTRDLYWIERQALYELDRKDGLIVWRFIRRIVLEFDGLELRSLPICRLDLSGSGSFPHYISYEDQHLQENPQC